jgi:23S rRNA pseudouridine2605 synthase
MTMNDKPRRPGARTFSPDRNIKPAAKRGDGKPVKATSDTLSAADAASGSKAERISKVMARAGVASRRDVERMIMEGRVTLNGVVLDSPVVNVTLADKIEVDGAPIRGIERTRLWLYHKAAGLVTTNSDPEGRPTVFDKLPEDLPRVMSIGRLDINTEGLLLLTNDGGLARVLELPATGWLRRYRVRAHGEVDQEALDKLRDGIAVDGVLYGSIEATLDRTQGSNVWITMALREGKNREIKNVLGAIGLDVNRLIRVSYGPFQLGELPEGKVLEVRGRTLRDQLGPRLIEEAKANFDAPLYDAPAVAAGDHHDDKAERVAKPDRWTREKPADKRERALSRLDTKRDDRRDSSRRDEDRPKRPSLGSRRSANVWMAPGARPLGEKAAKKAEKNAKTDARRNRDGRPQRGSLARPPEAPRAQVNRVREDDGEWIRSSETTRRPKDEGEGFERKRSFTNRLSRDDRPRDDRHRDDRPRSGGPPGDRGVHTEGDRPMGQRSFGDKPFGNPRGDRGPRPAGGDRPRAKSFSGETRSERNGRERPFGDKPFGKNPGGKTFGAPSSRGQSSAAGKPGGKSFGGKPGAKGGHSGRPSGSPPRGGPRGGGFKGGGKGKRG